MRGHKFKKFISYILLLVIIATYSFSQTTMANDAFSASNNTEETTALEDTNKSDGQDQKDNQEEKTKSEKNTQKDTANDLAQPDGSKIKTHKHKDPVRTIEVEGTKNLKITGRIATDVRAVAKKVKVDKDLLGIDNADNIKVLMAYDITLYDGAGKEWQPKKNVEIIADSKKIDKSISKNRKTRAVYVPDKFVDKKETKKLRKQAKKDTESIKTKKEKSGISFKAKHFSTYVIVELTEVTHNVVDITTIQEDVGYFIRNERSKVNYATSDIVDANTTPGISVTTEIGLAKKYYFDQVTNDTYQIYTYNSSLQKEYIHIDGVNVTLELTPQDLTVTERSSGVFLISSNGYYINKYSTTKFSAWNTADAGCYIKLSYDPEDYSDPYDIDGKTMAVICECDSVNYGHYTVAMSDVATTSSPYGLGHVDVTYDSTTQKFETVNPSDQLTLWTFEATDTAYYHIKAPNGQYINLNGNDNLTLSNTPMDLGLVKNGNQVSIQSPGGQFLDFYKNNGKEIFSSYRKTSVDDNNLFYLTQPEDGTIVYKYPEYVWQGESPDHGTTNNLPNNYTDLWSATNNTVREPSQSTYESVGTDYQWQYGFAYWKDENGNTYNPGTVIPTKPTGVLELSAVWEYIGTTEASRTVKYTIGNPITGVAFIDIPEISGGNLTELVEYPGFTSYTIRDVTGDKYTATNQLKYSLVGWETESGTVVEPSEVANLKNAEYDANADKRIDLTAVWDLSEDPWDIDGKEYLVVNNADTYAMAATPGTKTGTLDKFAVTRSSEGTDVYSSTGDMTVWLFEAQSDGTYYISTVIGGVKKYLDLQAATKYDGGGSLTISDNPCKFMLYKNSATGKYFIKKGENDTYGTYLDNFTNTGYIFGGWSLRNGQTPNNNKIITLGTPLAGTIVYRYPAYSGTYPSGEEDQGTLNTLPPTVTTRWTDENDTIMAPTSNKYTSSNEDYIWEYSFLRFKDPATGTYYTPGQVIEEPTGMLVLEAEWTYVSKLEIPRTVQYIVKPHSNNDTPEGVLPSVVGNLENNCEAVTGNWATFYTVRNITADYYKTTNNKTFEFMGWKTESDELISPGDIVDIDEFLAGSDIKRYDPNDDGVIKLTTVWGNTYADGKARKVNFFLSLKASSADIFNENAEISTDATDFTSAIHQTLMRPGDMDSPALGGLRWRYLISYQPGQSPVDSEGIPYTTTSMMQANHEIRELGGSGYLDTNGQISQGSTFSVIDFPSDETILNKLIALYSGEGGYLNGITLDGQQIEISDLTPENYTIRWYVCKYQGDGWHIDGKLTPKISFVTVTKTFAGDPVALQHIPNDFSVTLTDNNNTDIVYTLSLVDRTNNKTNYGFIGLIDDDENKRRYGYVGREGNTYTWVIPVVKAEHYNIAEHNYEITVDGMRYGVAAQYSITNSENASQDVPLTKWFGDVPGYVSTHATEDIEIGSMQATNLFNTYVETGIFVIEKRDSGTQDTVMSGVEFKVFEVIEGGTERQLTLSKKQGSSDDDGQYNVLYDDGSISDVAVTGSQGNVYLTLPRPTDPNELFTYRIEENVPAGYLEGTYPPSFKVSVNYQGLFTVDENDFVAEPGKNTISTVVTGTPGGTAQDAEITGVLVTNEPIKLLNVSIAKQWECPKESSVTIRLKGTAGGVEYINEDFILDDDNSWLEEETTLPLAIGNLPVIYTVEEIKIGDISSTENPTAFSNWTQQYLAPVYKDGEGNVLANSGSYVADEDTYKVRQIDFVIKNDLRDSGDATIKFNKISAYDSLPLSNVEFCIYEEDPNSTNTITYNGNTVYVTDLGYVVTSDSASVTLAKNKTYYFKETKTTSGYKLLDGWIKIAVDGYGNISMQSESGVSDYSSLDSDPSNPLNPLVKRLTVRNPRRDLNITVVNKDDVSELIANATFKMTKAGSAETRVVTSNSSGVLNIGDLDEGTYTLTHTVAPTGYIKLDDPIIITVNNTGISATIAGVSIMDPDVGTETDDDNVIIKYIYSMKIKLERNGEEILPAPTGYNLGFIGVAVVIVALFGIILIIRRRYHVR